MMPRPRLISCYYIYVDEYSDKCIDQSGMIGLTDASPDLNPVHCFFINVIYLRRKSVVGNPIVVHDNVIIN